MKTKSPMLDVSRASTLNTKLQLAHVNLFAVAAQRGSGAPEPPFSFTTRFESPSFAEFPSEVAALFPFVVTIEHPGKARDPMVELRVAFRAVYKKSPAFLAGDAGALPDYVGIVGWMQVWPYIRAEIQSLSTKLGFPPLVLPVLLSGQTADVPVTRLADASGEAEAKAKAGRPDAPPKGAKKPKSAEKKSSKQGA